MKLTLLPSRCFPNVALIPSRAIGKCPSPTTDEEKMTNDPSSRNIKREAHSNSLQKTFKNQVETIEQHRLMLRIDSQPINLVAGSLRVCVVQFSSTALFLTIAVAESPLLSERLFSRLLLFHPMTFSRSDSIEPLPCDEPCHRSVGGTEFRSTFKWVAPLLRDNSTVLNRLRRDAEDGNKTEVIALELSLSFLNRDLHWRSLSCGITRTE